MDMGTHDISIFQISSKFQFGQFLICNPAQVPDERLEIQFLGCGPQAASRQALAVLTATGSVGSERWIFAANKLRNLPNLEGSFSAVSKPIFAGK